MSLITVKRGSSVLKIEMDQLPRYVEKGFEHVIDHVEPDYGQRDIRNMADTNLVPMVRGENEILVEPTQVSRLLSKGYTLKEGEEDASESKSDDPRNSGSEDVGQPGGQGSGEGSASEGEDAGPREEALQDDGDAQSGQGGSEDPVEVDDEMILAALRQLDPTNDKHWTQIGTPRVSAVERILGIEVSKEEVQRAAPDFKRPEA